MGDVRRRVVVRADKPGLEVVGAKSPSVPLPGCPPKLDALLRSAGEGLLAGEVWLFGAGPRHDAARRSIEARLDETADTVGWLPLRRADRTTWSLLGEFVGGRGWLVWDAVTRALRCFVANGSWLPVGADLPDLSSFVAGRALFDELIGLRNEPLEEERARAKPSSYLVGIDPPGTALAEALLRGGDVQPAFEALLEQLPWPDGVLVAREVLRQHSSAEWEAHLALVVKRSELCRRFVAGLETPWRPVLAELLAAGFVGSGSVGDEALARLERRDLRQVHSFLPKPGQASAFFERLFLLSPHEAVTLQVDATNFAHTWPLALLTGEIRALRPLADAAYVASLDAHALTAPYADAFEVAALRVKSAPIDDETFAQLMGRASAPDCPAGVLALLATQAKRPGVMELFRELAQQAKGDVHPILDAATVCGPTVVALEALRLVYSRPRAWDEYSRDDAARVAAKFGDARARELVLRRQAAIARGIDRKM
jgi:hypothetical protein